MYKICTVTVPIDCTYISKLYSVYWSHSSWHNPLILSFNCLINKNSFGCWHLLGSHGCRPHITPPRQKTNMHAASLDTGIKYVYTVLLYICKHLQIAKPRKKVRCTRHEGGGTLWNDDHLNNICDHLNTVWWRGRGGGGGYSELINIKGRWGGGGLLLKHPAHAS